MLDQHADGRAVVEQRDPDPEQRRRRAAVIRIHPGLRGDVGLVRGASERCFAGRVDVGLREGRRTSPDVDAYRAARLEAAPVPRVACRKVRKRV